MSEEFDRAGDTELRSSIVESLASKLGLASTGDMMVALEELLGEVRAGRVSSDAKIAQLNECLDQIERIQAFDSPWVFGHRYMSHKFVSTDPTCMNCKNAVPHRTMIQCPTCGGFGPWSMIERALSSSHIHFLLVEQLRRLIANELTLPGGLYRADGTATAVPRGGAKSTWLCEIASSWLLLTKRSRCLLLLSNTIKQVTERAIEIKTELEENAKIIEDFGVQAAPRQDPRMWTQEDFVLPNGGRLVARGAMQSMRGVKNNQYRPDVVIADDADDEKYLTSSEMSKKLHDWWNSRVVPACHPNAAYCFHGTVLGEQALLWQALRKTMGASYKHRIIKALNDGCGCSVCGMPAPRVGPFDCPVCRTRREAISPYSFWGARFTVESLGAIRKRVGHWAWSSEYQQEPHDDSTSWFDNNWLTKAKREDLGPLSTASRRVIPWSLIRVSLNSEELLKLCRATGDPAFNAADGVGPYQMMVQAWDPAWARAKPSEQLSCWMAGVSIGLTWDDKIDVHFITRNRGLAGNAAYLEWMYKSWVENGVAPDLSGSAQCAMIIERNGGGVLFQYGVQEHWKSIPMVDHFTGVEKHDLHDGIPGMASWFKDDRVIIRANGALQPMADEMIYELRQSGSSQYTDVLMALWIGWAYINRWIRDVRDPERYNEMTRRRHTGRMSNGNPRSGTR